MKLSFSPISSFGDLLIVTTAVAIAFGAAPGAIAFSHPVGALAETTQQLAQMILQAPVQLDYLVERVTQGSLEGNRTDIFHLLRQGNVFEKNPDNPPPIPGSPGGSR